jgi:hypothetical protein
VVPHISTSNSIQTVSTLRKFCKNNFSSWGFESKIYTNNTTLFSIGAIILEESRRWVGPGSLALPLLVTLGLGCNLSLLLGFDLVVVFMFVNLYQNSLFFLMKTCYAGPKKHTTLFTIAPILWFFGTLWRPRFLISVINANDRITWVKLSDIGQTMVNLGHHLENLVNNP